MDNIDNNLLGPGLFFLGYIDPTSGQVFQSFFSQIITFLAPLLLLLLAFFRNFFKKLFNKKIIFLGFILIILGLIFFFWYFMVENKVMWKKPSKKNKVVILAVDGLDPEILNKGLEQNLLPNFKYLKETGYFSKLETVTPPQSPVVWASFITSTNPSVHKIFDFIQRDAKTYQLDLFQPNNLPHSFWDATKQASIPTTVLFLPDTFPAPQSKGKFITGMGTPDILGKQGGYTLFTTKKDQNLSETRGRIVILENSDLIKSEIVGPKFQFLNELKTATIPIKIEVHKDKSQIEISLPNNFFSLKEKEFSEWIPLEFKLDYFTKMKGIVKFYLHEIGPEITLYMSPINIDPMNPSQNISFPKDFSQELVKNLGSFSTLGMPYDTWALEENAVNEEIFLKLADLTFNERKNIYFNQLGEFEDGLFVMYFGITDSIQHMFWQFQNEDNHPYQNTILNYYKKIDEVIGKTINTIDDKTTLIILSDHGFSSLNYEININSWLKENGFLSLKDNKKTGQELLRDIDWSKTKAYSIGFNSIYFNIKGREKEGIVDKSEVKILENEIKKGLLSLVNPLNNEKVVKNMYSRNDLGIQDNDNTSPDLVIGYFKGIRSSWSSAAGGLSKEIIKERDSKWSGDHLFDKSEVPGVLMINKNNFSCFSKTPIITEVMSCILDYLIKR